MPDPKTWIPVLTDILIGEAQPEQKLASELGLKPQQLSAIKAGREKFPERRRAMLVEKLQKRFPAANFSAADLDLPVRDFLNRFPREGVNYRRCLEVAGLRPDPEDVEESAFTMAGRMKLLHGAFVRLYLCADPADKRASAVAINDFTIEHGSQPLKAIITQRTYEHEAQVPRGTVKLRDNTLEFHIDYRNSRHPFGVFMGPMPTTNEITGFLAMSLDIKFQSRATVARPMIFIRVSEFFSHANIYNSGTLLYKSTKALLDAHISYHPEKFEMVPSERISEEYLAEVLLALESIRREAAG